MKNALSVVGIILVIAAVKILVPKASFEQQLVATAKQLNTTLPKMIDSETRLDSTKAGPGKRFTYKYTLVNQDGPIDQATQTMMKNFIVQTAKSTPELAVFKNNGATLVYSYKDKNSKFLFKIEITPEMY